MLQHRADLFTYVVCWLFTEPEIVAGCWVDYAHEHSQGGGLATTVGAQHAENLTALYGQAQVIDGTNPAESFRQVLNSKYVIQ